VVDKRDIVDELSAFYCGAKKRPETVRGVTISSWWS